MMRARGGWLLAIVALLGVGCSAPAPAPRSETDIAVLAADALDAGQYAKAADLYRRALAKAPESVALHYGLAVALSHLDGKAEAIREFLWVLERAVPGTPEADNARRWLVSVGALAARPTASFGPDEPSAASTATVEGRVLSVGGPESGPLKRQQLVLVEHPSRVHHYRMRTDEDGRYRFTGVAPGIYKLSDRVTGPAKWRLRVEAKPGQAIFLDLGPDNSTSVRDDFRDRN